MTDSTVPTSLKSLIEEEHRASAPRYQFIFGIDKSLTEEERKQLEIRKSWRYRLEHLFQTLFKETLIGSPSPKYLLAIPGKLARNYELSTNAVMRAIVSIESTTERIAHLEELTSRIWMGERIYSPSAEDVFIYFNRVQGRVDDLKECTLAECYWLLEIAKWTGCLLTVNCHAIEKAFAVKDSVNELDFTRTFDRQDENDKLVLEAVFKQYHELEKFLRRF